jgi:hypothetical protein
MSMQVLPTAPSPTVTHLMNREALDAMAARASPRFSEPRVGEKRERSGGGDGTGEEEGRTPFSLAFLVAFGLVLE